MNAAKLLERILENGADAKGINDRFCGNAELFAQCFQEFLEEPNLAWLQEAVAAKEYDKAFDAAHALKGLSGNLGLTGYYDAICVLVESLRSGHRANVASEYDAVLRQLTLLRRLQDETPPPVEAPTPVEAPPAPKPGPASETPSDPKKKRRRFFLLFLSGLVLFSLCVAFLFTTILGNYQKKTANESASHLVEISTQISLHIEERISSDWKIAGSIGDSILYGNYFNNDANLLSILRRQRQRWNVTDIQIINENGYCVSADGKVETNDDASDLAAKSRDAGQYMTVLDSQLIYTIPLETELRFHGSRVVAISVIQNMVSFLDDMEFASFGGKAWMYLTEQNGIVLSRLCNDDSASFFNFASLLKERELTVLSEDVAADELLTTTKPAAFIMSGHTGKEYVVSSSIRTSTTALRLFFLVPVDVVNAATNSFSTQLSNLGLLVVLVMVLCIFGTFMLIYRNRKKQFDSALLARERLFDLLSANTMTAFGLFYVNAQAPDFVSSNFFRVTGEPYYALERSDAGYHVRGGSGRRSEAILQINDKLHDWDGKSEFRSGYIPKDNSLSARMFSMQLFPVGDEEQSFVGILQDVTKTYERENTTTAALLMAERSNEAKSRFLSNMSHDIRTPMNAIVNMAGFAIENILHPKKLRLYLQTIQESSDHLLHLINDVLDMSRIESGQTLIESLPFHLKQELERQVSILRPLADEKKLTFLSDFERVHTTDVRGDRVKFSQIMLNLLNNAIKFTPNKGAVRFTVEEMPSLREDMVSIRCVIEDNGIGISHEDMPHIFEPFHRASDNRVAKIEGTGLGLSICHNYVKAMGGTIRCDSEAGEGSTFVVELFFQKALPLENEPAEPLVQSQQPFLGKHCLLAEDNLTNQLIACTMLERLGFLIDVVSDGLDCVQKFAASAPGIYDIIYMDIQMPTMDGYQATTAIRQCGHPQSKTIPIVAMTANVFSEDIEKARIAGMDGHLGKPLLSPKLLQETQHAIDKRKENRP